MCFYTQKLVAFLLQHLLRTSKLEALVVQWIKSKEQVEGVCKLLSQNIETLASLRFNHCKLSSEFVNAICESLLVKDLATHGIQHFTFNTSRLLEADSISIPAGLNSFLSSARFIITNNGSGHTVNGLKYKEYELRDYSSWFLKQLNSTHNWKKLKSCLVKADDCNDLSKKYKTLKQFKLAKLTPIEAGCCRPPSNVDKDCKLYKNTKNVRCYNCDSCKAGVAQYMKTEWRVVAIFNLILFAVLSIIYFVGCCARRNASRNRTKV